MNKEVFDNNQELEQLRQDYAVLKERFDKQQIVNEQLMQNAMKRDVKRIFLSKKSTIAASALLIIAVILSFAQRFEWWVSFSLILFGLTSIPVVIWVYKGVHEEDIYNGDILTTAETLRKFKKRYLILEAFVCIFFFAFVVWAMIYVFSSNISTQLMWRRVIILALLCIGALYLEYYFAKRLLKACDDIIERLKMKDE
jgi:hypothetical protein